MRRSLRSILPVFLLLLPTARVFAAPEAPAVGGPSATSATSSTSAPSREASAPAPRSWDLTDWELTPVQAGGRVKPMAAFAAELVLHLTSRRSFEGWRPSELVLSFVAEPAAWRQKPLIKIEREDVKRQLLVDVSKMRFSVGELFANPVLLQYAQRMGELESTMAKAPSPNENPRE